MPFIKNVGRKGLFLLAAMFAASNAAASEVDLILPELDVGYNIFGYNILGTQILSYGLVICVLGLLFGLCEFVRIRRLPAHKSMLAVSETIYETCKTYMKQQAKLLVVLELFIAACIFYYFYFLSGIPMVKVLNILLWSILGILGSFSVAWFGMRINTYANSRTAFASLKGKAFDVMSLPLRSGMSIGVLLICVELILMIVILLWVPKDYAGACFIGFAIGESLGASALRICGGIFTKIADIGADLMKIIFKIDEDDARNPGVIADCVGDNAGDSVGPTADGFETYGVTGVALVTFIMLAVGMFYSPSGELVSMAGGITIQAKFIVWIFAMRLLMILTSIFSYWLNAKVSKCLYGKKEAFDFEAPLTSLVWVTSIVSIMVTFAISYIMLKDFNPDLWWRLATIISCGTFAAAVIPEFTKIFTSAKSKHVSEIVNASREGGASLNIISGLVAGNFSAFWKGLVMVALMAVAYFASLEVVGDYMIYPSVFAFGLVAFGMLGMGPVTIAVDSYGPVTDNAQSVFELSQIEQIKGVAKDIEIEYGFKPNFRHGKDLLEENDSAGNTFKATAKPVLIGTAVIGATTMIFSIILMLGLKLELLDAHVLFGLILGGAVIYWFSGASMQAVSAGAYKAVNYIKQHIKLDGKTAASIEESKEVVRICTVYAQKGMLNIFIAIFSFTICFACLNASLFASYLISIAIFGLFQALFMANGGGAWDNAKKVVEVDLKEKGTDLHAATVVGDTVGDPFKDTSSVSLNPIIKFTTLFGLLAVEMAEAAPKNVTIGASIVFGLIALFFVYRSFYNMRIEAAKK
ncbi:MAG: sodium-translocating pyrophosphatase [Lactobacillaceae bacterium]|jgi:K(+)-stimulated pyrophosphate-energized sodium pump|nr:sodium-translocating pyrophosphatase [Lactobacillaceae bacterium]